MVLSDSSVSNFVNESITWIKKRIDALYISEQFIIDLSNNSRIQICGETFLLQWNNFENINKNSKRKKFYVKLYKNDFDGALYNNVKDNNVKIICIASDKVPKSLANYDLTNKQKVLLNFTNWLKEYVKDIFHSKVVLCSEKTGLAFNSSIAKNLKRTWGIYHSNGSISLNWRLSLAPVDVLNGVIIHELCHSKVKGHGKDFWELLYYHCPDYKETVHNWLKKYGRTVYIDYNMPLLNK